MEMFNWKAENKIYLGEETGGKGRFFKARFLQAGLVKYSFGVCVLEKESIDKFIQGFVGCPVVIDHKDVTHENAKDVRVGVISRVWYDEKDGWYWCEGIIFDENALDLIESGYNVSCQYEITEYAENRTKELHNGNPYDKVILNGKPEHLAIVKNPRYENAMIAVNAIELDAEKASNGWITLDKTDEEGNRIKIYIEGAVGQTQEEKRRKADILGKYKKGEETKYDFSHTRAKVSETQQQQIKSIIQKVYHQFAGKPLAQVEVRSIGGGALGLCTAGRDASIVGLDSSIFSGKYTQADWEKSIKSGFHPKTDNKEMITCVLTHELGHAISVNTDSKDFWKEIKKVQSDYLAEVKKDDTKHPDFISKYARVNEYEFVAEAFAQAQLSKKYGKYTKQVAEIMEKHLAKSTQLKIAADNSQKDEDIIIWEEEFGGGYPINEEAYEEMKKNQSKDDNKAKNSFQEEFKQALKTAIIEVVSDRLGE